MHMMNRKGKKEKSPQGAPESDEMHRGNTPEVKRVKTADLSTVPVLSIAEERKDLEKKSAVDAKNPQLADKLEKARLANRDAKLKHKIGPYFEQLLATIVKPSYLDRVTTLLEEFKNKYRNGDRDIVSIVDAAINDVAFDAAMNRVMNDFITTATSEHAAKVRMANRQARLTFKIRPSFNRLLAEVNSSDIKIVLAQQKKFSEEYLAGNPLIVAEVDASLLAMEALTQPQSADIDAMVQELTEKCTKILATAGEAILTDFNRRSNPRRELRKVASPSAKKVKM